MNAFVLIRRESEIDCNLLCEVYIQKEIAIERLKQLVTLDIKDGWRKCSLDSDTYVSLQNGYTTRNYTIEKTKINGNL